MRHLAKRMDSLKPTLRRLAVPLVFLFAALSPIAAGPFEEGERLFRENKPAEAAPVLERALLEPAVDERAYLYLALAYEQLGRYDAAVATLRKGLPSARLYRHLFYYNLGNAFVLLGRNTFAEESYDESIAANPSYAPARLNRANARLALGKLGGAAEDYRAYLGLEPASAQRSAIEALLVRLEGALAAEAQRIAAESAAKAQAEAARKALLDQVAASLKAAAEETMSLSAGTGQIQGYDDTLELDE